MGDLLTPKICPWRDGACSNFTSVSRLWFIARRRGYDLVVVLAAIDSGCEAALRHDALREPRSPMWFAVPAAAVLVATLLGRRRFPFAAPAALWLTAAAVSFVDGRLVTFIVALTAAGLAASFLLGQVPDGVQRRVGLAIVLSGAAIVMYNDPSHAVGDLLLIPMMFATAWLGGFALRERGEEAQVAQDRATAAECEREQNARRAVFEERVRIARELHDVIAHHVSMMGVQAGAARMVIQRDPDKASQALRAIETSSREAVVELHRLLGFLRQAGDQDDLAAHPGVSQLPSLTAGMRESDLLVELGIEGEQRPLPPTVDVSAYRIVQEALTNTLKHAQASRADVRLRYWPGELEVEVVDDGRGPGAPSAQGPGGLGLIGMRERAALHGGQLTAGPVPGGGFSVRVKLSTRDRAP
jgi:signal transduction histidine kinase